ncbi:MAG: N-acetylmuramoyl-L-alanine amidase [Treponema sp.]|nr:N-acetylmuramoyl-L-alanine amidase [Treponema sp.]
MNLLILYLFLFAPSLFSLSLDETLNTLKTLSASEAPQFRWDPLIRQGEFNLGDHCLTFTSGRKGETGYLLFDNRELLTSTLPWVENGSLVFPDSFMAAVKNIFEKNLEMDSSRFRVAAIIIDPGHGGRDSGTKGTITANGKTAEFYEKDIVLRAGLGLRNLLSQTYPDKRIMMTRDSDVYISLEKRADMANAVAIKENEAVVFISIHVNWGANPGARGYEVWHINSGYRRTLIDSSKHQYSSDIMAILNAMLEEEYTTESILLANSILNGFGQILGKSVPSRGRKANDWFVVKNSRMPAVLVELGFVSNAQDAKLMTSEDGLQKIIEALYKGIRDYIGIFERQ